MNDLFYEQSSAIVWLQVNPISEVIARFEVDTVRDLHPAAKWFANHLTQSDEIELTGKTSLHNLTDILHKSVSGFFQITQQTPEFENRKFRHSAAEVTRNDLTPEQHKVAIRKVREEFTEELRIESEKANR